MGENFRFGAKAKGDPEMLAARQEFETEVVPLVEVDGEIVSSTPHPLADRRGRDRRRQPVPRRALPARGPVVEGDRRGRTLGFPTANLVPQDDSSIPGTASMRPSPTGSPRR